MCLHISNIIMYLLFRPSIRTYAEASMPNSPTRQLNWIRNYRKPVEKTSEELENYARYLASPQTNIVLKGKVVE